MNEFFNSLGLWFSKIWLSLSDSFYQNFIEDSRYLYIVKGLWVTIQITVFAVLIGLIIGFFVAIVRSTYDKQNKRGFLLRSSNKICNFYLTVIRGTPVVVQLLLIFYIIFAWSRDIDKILVAIIAFGLNSGAYQSEVFRGGIMSIDNGQFEAGRSMGFDYKQTMWHIIMPQAFKNILPALGNEVIVLLKETSVAGFIALEDLTRSSDIISSITYDMYMPLIGIALIYLGIVMFLSYLLKKLERRLRNSDH